MVDSRPGKANFKVNPEHFVAPASKEVQTNKQTKLGWWYTVKLKEFAIVNLTIGTKNKPE